MLVLREAHVRDAPVRRAHVQPAEGADPQIAIGGGVQTEHHVGYQAAGIAFAVAHLRDVPVRTQPRQAACISAHPDRAVRCLRQREHVVGAQAVRVAGFVHPALEPVTGDVMQQAGSLTTGPQPAAGIDQQRRNIVVRQRMRIAGVVAEHLEMHAVVAHQTIARADPDEAPGILHGHVTAGVGHPLAAAVVAELRGLQQGARGRCRRLGRGLHRLRAGTARR